ncbi:bacterio-opsin activator domain-containing protein [Halobacterium salinarum]|uniref:Integrase family protein / bat box HTH-10 family transcription regulator n=1 Tax=Halobacterium salinarum (strain ATCC 33171 / DSM 3754 / JCM 8978 / NBRC 102687 / NCIMB 764 / 91-R6) TaxID=2597657 RepID=A0A4D6GW87_HALS9|nr:bacterio-opsin activator domain-containing protein [Halobacterium salinarum]QCC44828.1 integrase family protein / bat box HTH-10 family transcription regulator [Halobacterium salinarum]TYO75588.1 hypothetical protein APQ99_01912 [Halobacterium salinarum DSM 3754]
MRGADGRVTDADYRELRGATETPREAVVVGLAGEVGLTSAEIPRVRPCDVAPHDHDGVTHYFLAVPGADGGSDRDAYLPPAVERDIRRRADAAGLADDDPLVDVSARRVQTLVNAVAERTDTAGLDGVSAQDLRSFFARRLLTGAGVDPRVVAAVGGWSRLASLDQYAAVDAVDRDAIARAFDGTTRAPTDRSEQRAHDRVDEAHRAVLAAGDALSDASTRGAVETAVCEALAASDAYEMAWLARPTTRDDVTVAATAGGDRAIRDDASAAPGATLVQAALDDGTGLFTPAASAAPAVAALREHAAAAGVQAMGVVPVAGPEAAHGVLAVGASTARFSQRERTLITDLGRRVGRAVALAEQRHRLLTDTVLEVTFEVRAGSVFARAAVEQGCDLSLEGVVPGDRQTLVFFVRIAGAPADGVRDWLHDHDGVVSVRVVRDQGGEAVLAVGVAPGADLAMAVVSHGGTIRDLSAGPGGERVVAGVALETDVRALLDALATAFPGVSLAAKRERARGDETGQRDGASLHDALTDKQAAVLRAAFHAGYFEWPRESTAEDLAADMGVTAPTLHNHLRRAQQKLLATVIDSDGGCDPDTPWPDTRQ